jgi:hypothetical protein
MFAWTENQVSREFENLKEMAEKMHVTEHLIVSRIHVVRGQRVMLDEDLAEMYGVETKRLNEQVKRNPDRFPDDFMFQLTKEEFDDLMSQNATSSWGGRRKLPSAFTEHGVLMLSSVLNSPTAVQVNIRIMRVYAKLREMLMTHKDVLLKLEEMEGKVTRNSEDISAIFNALKQLLTPPSEPRTPIGYRTSKD